MVTQKIDFTVPLAAPDTFGHTLLPNIQPLFNVFILCINKGQGLIPIRLMLPHQVTAEAVEQIITDNPGTQTVIIIPAHNSNYKDVAIVRPIGILTNEGANNE